MPKGLRGQYQSGQLYGNGAMYHSYRANAHRKGLDFKLSKSDVVELILKPCHYCGIEPTERSNFGHIATESKNPGLYNYLKGQTYKANGIDRLDNTKGYVVENCVPCCTMCNTAKSNWPIDQWNTWLKRIIAFQTSS